MVFVTECGRLTSVECSRRLVTGTVISYMCAVKETKVWR